MAGGKQIRHFGALATKPPTRRRSKSFRAHAVRLSAQNVHFGARSLEILRDFSKQLATLTSQGCIKSGFTRKTPHAENPDR